MHKVLKAKIDKENSNDEWTQLLITGEDTEEYSSHNKNWKLPVLIKLDDIYKSNIIIKCDEEVPLLQWTSVVLYLQSRYDMIAAALQGAF